MCKFYDSEYTGWHMLHRGILISSQRNFHISANRFILRYDFFYQKFMKGPKHHCVGDPMHNTLKLKKGTPG